MEEGGLGVFNNAVQTEGRNCYGIALLSTFLYFLYREINNCRIIDAVDIVQEELNGYNTRRKLNITTLPNDETPKRLKYAIEFSSHPRYTYIGSLPFCVGCGQEMADSLSGGNPDG